MQGKEYMILNEIEVLKRISKGHKNIVTLWDYFETPNNLYFVMDLCTGGELFDRICEKGSFYEEDAAKVIKSVLDATAYLHSQNIVHRDIKPENLLFKTRDSSELVLADFGLSKIVDTDKIDGLRTTCGTPGYMAPEVLRKAGHGKPVDLWCIGVMTYFLLSGYTPFDHNAKGSQEELDNILKGKFTFEEDDWQGISAEAKDFISKLLVLDPKGRMTAQEALKHSWITEMVVPSPVSATVKDLFPSIRKGFDARRVFRKAVGAVRAINRLSTSSPMGSKVNVHSVPSSAATSTFSLDQGYIEHSPHNRGISGGLAIPTSISQKHIKEDDEFTDDSQDPKPTNPLIQIE